MEEKELLKKLKQLKQIKPTATWESSLKASILGTRFTSQQLIPAWVRVVSFWGSPAQKMVYAMAALLVAVFGTFGVISYHGSNTAPSSVAVSPETITVAKQEVAILKQKSMQLSGTKNTALALQEAQDATKNLTATIKQNPTVARELVLDIVDSQTYLDVIADHDPEVTADFYTNVLDLLFAELDGVTFNENKTKEYNSIKASYHNGGDPGTILKDILVMSSGTNH